jgi:hypothetical protein
LESVRKLDVAKYSVRAAAADGLRDLKAASAGNTELDLLAHQTVSPKEAAQPFFVLARLRAAQLTADLAAKTRLYSESIALKPSLRIQRLALAEAAFKNKHDALGLAAWQSYESPNHDIPWLHSSPLDLAIDQDIDRTPAVEELVAETLAKRREYSQAEAMYDRLLQQATDNALRGRIEKLRDAAAAAARLDQLNRSRAPLIGNELAQAGIVKPKLKGAAE